MNLIVNQRVEIIVDDEPYQGSYLSRIEETTEKQITVAIPMQKGEIVPLRSGTIVSVVFFDDLAVYEFQAKITRSWQDGIPVLIMPVPAKIKRIQRRSFVRLEVLLPLRIYIDDKNGNSILINAQTADISGGGARVSISKRNLEAIVEFAGGGNAFGCKLKMELVIRDKLDEAEQIVEFIGGIIRHGEKSGDHWLAICFDEISERHRDKIISFIFKKQLEFRNRGLI